MERYLLFDGGCTLCSELAQAIEQETHGWLTARSLHDPLMKQLLDKECPNWTWEPTLVEINEGHIRVSTGIKLHARLAIAWATAGGTGSAIGAACNATEAGSRSRAAHPAQAARCWRGYWCCRRQRMQTRLNHQLLPCLIRRCLKRSTRSGLLLSTSRSNYLRTRNGGVVK